MKRLNRIDTRLEIIRAATKMFLEDGFDSTSAARIASSIGISTGNLTFHFPKKEHLLVEAVEELCDFQWKIMKQNIGEGESALMAYCLEITAIASCCEKNEKAKSFYSAAYSHPMTLAIIQKNDTKKAKEVFGQYHPDWNEKKFENMENIVSGIEFTALFTPGERTPLNERLDYALNAILLLYEIPAGVRESIINKVLSSDYASIGKRIFSEFTEYANRVNDEALENAIERNREKQITN
ncbi:MAG: helix-turn-helix transcriptional regulator [Clostridia bacterium]|nr:helix-turn-helix transcriptional regulator [Clostridia bacterium]